jgi:argininosuccinate synthase
MSERPVCVLAFSGGLDTSLCVVWLREEHGYDVVTVTVDTGGFSPEELGRIEARSKETGAVAHHTIDGTGELFDDWIRHIIAANYQKGGVYPLSVGVERVVQARHLVEVARRHGAVAVAHGSTGAGNDQIRFDVVLRTLGPELQIHAPIRTLGWGRAQEADYLTERGFEVDASTRVYSVNEGMWGTTIGGGETKRSDLVIPESVYPSARSEEPPPSEPTLIELRFERGVPVAINGEAGTGPEVIRALEEIGRRYGVGRGIHLGDTILGIKGRIAFEAPAAQMLLHAHRELEKLVLTKWQSLVKEQVSAFYGLFLHEGKYLDPAMRDIEALLDSSQRYVTGTVTLRVAQGTFLAVASQSPYSLLDARRAAYGEESGLWDGRDAEGFARILSIQSMLAVQVRAEDEA